MPIKKVFDVYTGIQQQVNEMNKELIRIAYKFSGNTLNLKLLI